MVFKCQEDSFLKEFTSTVVSCTKSNFNAIIDGKKTQISGYEVICENTILFPEGGGQPSDHGFLNDKKVFQVTRRGSEAVHFVEDPFNIGDNVKQVIKWDRRLDHMQQHSGQHLVTAIIERDFKYPTVSWWLGEEDSYIELDTPSITAEQIKQTENTVNELIQMGRSVTVQVLKEGTPEEEIEKVRARDLPKDHKGDIRLITIDGVESNMCCGTHVTNLCQLQVIKLLHTEKSGRKNKMLLHFLVGNRVVNKLRGMLEREQKLTSLLNNGPSKHAELVDKLLKNTKTLNKNLQSTLKDIVLLEVSKLKSVSPLPKYFSYHRKEAETDFMNNFIKEFASTEVFLFLSVGDEKTTGNIVLYGSENAISDLGETISQILNGKGAGKGNKFQAKVTNMINKTKVEKLLEEYFK